MGEPAEAHLQGEIYLKLQPLLAMGWVGFALAAFSITSLAIILQLAYFFLFRQSRADGKEPEYMSIVWQQRIDWLSHIASLSTLLGLLGTVLGIQEAFEAMRAKGQASPEVFATGISLALSTTILGLAIALPSLFFHHVFANLWEKRQVEEDL